MERVVHAGAHVLALLQAERDRVCPRSDMRPGCFKSDELSQWQAQVYSRGFRGVQLVQTIYGWSVRSDTGLDEWQVLAGHRMGNLPNATKEQAIEWAKQWQADDADRRYVVE